LVSEEFSVDRFRVLCHDEHSAFFCQNAGIPFGFPFYILINSRTDISGLANAKFEPEFGFSFPSLFSRCDSVGSEETAKYDKLKQ